MMPLRILAGIVASAALAGYAASAFGPAATAQAPASTSVSPAPGAETLPGEPLPPAPVLGASRPQVPPGLLGRAADARALERGPACPPPAAAPAPPVCSAPEERESIEIEWHVEL